MLEDGTGKGYKLRINDNNRAEVDAVTHTSAQEAAEEGRLFQIGAGIVNLTSATESALLYIKNEGDKPLEIVNVTISSGLSTGAVAGDVLLAKLYTDALTITNSAVAPFVNNNLGSSKTPEATYLAGVQGSAITGGALGGATFLPVANFERVNLYWILPRGASLAISITPPAGNTSLNVGCFVDIYESTEND